MRVVAPTLLLSKRFTSPVSSLVGAVGCFLTLFFATPDALSGQSGPVAAYGFNETSGTTTADVSGNNNTGTLGAGVTRTTSGKFGSALVIANGYVTVPHAASLNLTTAMTLEAWVFPTSAQNYGTVVMKEQPGQYTYVLYGSAPTNPSLEFNTGTSGSTAKIATAPSALPLNTWSHIAGTYDGTTMRVYVNGVQVLSKAQTGSIRTSTNALRIGGNSVWGEYFSGRIDEVRIYNRSLSAAEITTDMNTAIGSADATPPAVAITTPTTNPTYGTSTTPITLGGTASDNVGVTQVTWVNDRGGSGTATGTTSWTASGIALQSGTNVLTVTARDAANNTNTATLTVTYTIADVTNPTIAITGPTSNPTYLTNATPVTLGGTAGDNVGVTQVTWSNSATGANGTATGTTSWSVSGVALQAGANPITVTARDAANNVGTATLTVTLDAVVPTVTVTAPGAGATVSGTAVNVTASATDNGALAGVTFLVDGVAVGSEVLGAGPTYATTWNTSTVGNGPHTVTARARDAAGNTAVSADVSVTVSNTVPSGLVAAYGFDEASGATTADVSGSANTGTLGSGVTRTVSGKFGGALVFNNGYVTVPHAASLNLTTAMTLEAWVFPTSPQNWGTAVMKEQAGQYDYVLYGGAPANPSAEFNTGSTSATARKAIGPSSLPLNTWSHLAGTYDGSTLRLYVNGVQVVSQATSGAITTSTGALRIGGNGVWGEYFAGRIDEVRVYDRALTLGEITTDMNTAVGGGGPPVDVTNPTIAITSPTTGSTHLTNGTPLTLGGTAGDNVGVTQVTWANSATGANGTATGTTSWSVTGVALQSGANPITVTARDAANNVATATLTVTLDATGPVVAITTPTSNPTYPTSAANLTVGGTASDANGVTQVTWANTTTGTNGTASGTTTWSAAGIALQPGANTITVTARDGANNTSTATLTATLDATVPTVAITSPTTNPTHLTNATPLTVGGTAGDNIGVTQVTWANTTTGTTGTATGTATWSASGIALQAGANALTVTVHDAADNVATATLTVTLDATVPIVAITTPTSNPTYPTSAANLTIGGTASDANDVTQVTWANTTTGASGTASGTTTWSAAGIALQPGANTITVTARDGANNTSSATLTATLDATVPTVAITSPTANSTLLTNSAPLSLSGTASDNIGVTQVTWVNSATGASGTATGTTSWSASGIALQAGANALTVTVHDAVDNVATATLTVTLDATVPTVTITAPGAGATVSGATVSLTASASDNNALAGVTFLVDGAPLGSEVAGAGPTFATTWNTTTLANGPHTVAARARDAAGNTAVSADVSVTVSNAVPSGLVAAYAFSEASGTTTADVSGNSNTGTLGTGVTRTTSGKFGSALVFNSGYVTVPHAASLNLTTAMTLEAWLYPTAASGWATAVMKEQSGQFDYVLYGRAPNTPGAYFNAGTSGNTERQLNGTSTLPQNTWSHLAGTYDGTTLRLYVNGTQVSAAAMAGPITQSTGALRIGGNAVWGEYFTGRIDEVRIYNRALSASEITTDMNTAVSAPVDVTAPSIAITSPTSNPTFGTTATPITLGGTASDDVGVTQVTWANTTTGTNGTATGTTSWTASGIALQSGTNVLTVTARDAANNIATATLTVTYTIAADVTNPTIAITSPTSNPTHATNTTPLTLSGTASDNVAVTQVTWANSATGANGTATGTTSWSVSGVALQVGANPITVTARDAANNLGTATLTVTLDAVVPTVTVTAPGAGATVSGTTVNVTASASDNGALAGVTFLVDGVAVGSEVVGAGPTYATTWNTTTVGNGPHTVTARARDAAGNTALSPDVSVTVSNAAPSGLVAAYGFNEVSGSSAIDVSGNANTGTFGAGVTRTASGKFGGALVFNSAYVTVPNAASLNLTTDMTLEAWVYPTANSNWRTAVMKEQPGEFVYALYVGAPSTPGGYFNAGTGSGTERQVNAPSALSLNTWSHLAITYDGTTSRLYVNGSQVASQNLAGPIQQSPGALRIGGNAVWGEYFTGRIDEVRIYNRALLPAEVVVDMGTAVGDSPTPDTTAPTVSMTSPAAGATVAGTVSVSAAASDNVAVAGVQFLLDGSPLGAEVTAAPYSTLWNAADVLEGPHTLEAVARDLAGNVTHSASIQVTVSAPSGSTVGQWSAPFNWPLVSIHASLLKTGEVLSWEYDGAGGPILWNPVTNQFTPVPNSTNLFCAGQAQLPDGRVLIAGGHVGAHVGLPNLTIFDPVTRGWTAAPDMAFQRWYPGVTALPDGRSLITAGETSCDHCNVLIPEIYNPFTNHVTRLNNASWNFPYYPHMFVMPDGRVFAAATSEEPIVSQILNVATETWTSVDPTQQLSGGSSVMYLPGKVMKSGTPHDPDLPADPSTNKTYVIDMTAQSPAWTETPPMAFPRTYHTTTILPDGNVLVTGGAVTSDPITDSGAVLSAELWSPTTKTYQTLSAGAVPRLYHSVALLLPDGRVLITGGGRWFGFPSSDPSNHLNAEIYSPPYLFKGARPTITTAPQAATYGATIGVASPDVGAISSVSLVKLGSVTHAINMDQRFVPLSFTPSGGELDVQMPANAIFASPGYYMLFIVNGNGVPSKAAIIQIQ